MKIWGSILAKKKHVLTLAFLLGFIIDSFMLTRVDLTMTVAVLLAYLFIATLGVMFTSISRGGALAPYLTQFAFGGLLSGYFIFFTRSASFASSWFFILLLGVAIFGNEFLKEEYRRFELRITMLFAAFFFFAIIYAPVALKSMGAWIFLSSGLVGLGAIVLVLMIISHIAPEIVRTAKYTLTMTIGSLFVGINALYFTNIIPPIPLSLKEAGVYHVVSRTESGGYRALVERVEWYNFAQRYHAVIHREPDEPLYFYSSVFAPTHLSVPIFHEWQYLDDIKNEWVTTDRLNFQIVGGRDGGYRGYSFKGNIFTGEWRVNVITERGQYLGRTSFTVIDVSTSIAQEVRVLGEK